jgi:quinoprotein glucose dehydrogenase
VKGYVRAFDVKTGKRLWIFHTVPQKGEFGANTWLGDADQSGNAGVWAQISADPDLNMVYLPVEMPTGDFHGSHRPGDGLFGESIVAVDLYTGERKWHYQTVHHGIWDHDLPAAPILADVPMGGRVVKAIAVPTKQSFLFVLNRATGKPIWPIHEKPVPKGDVPGEWYAPTQPIPSLPPPFDNQGVSESDLIDFTPELRAQAVELVKNYKIGPLYTPPVLWEEDGLWGLIMAPGVTGGANWGGGAYDPETHRLFIYSKTEPQVIALYKNTTDKTKSDLDYLTAFNGPPVGAKTTRRGPFRAGDLRVEGLPLFKPPWGRITAIDMTRGRFAWQIAHGETLTEVTNHPKLKDKKIPRTGRAGILGVLATKSLVICGEAGFGPTPNGQKGAMLRAYDKMTGEEKGAVHMPAPQSGSPMTYMAGGQQYLVVAVSGADYSAELIAYRLPKA